jgi:hypothetical protein
MPIYYESGLETEICGHVGSFGRLYAETGAGKQQGVKARTGE